MKTVIGLEIHNQLRSESKLFCTCPTAGYREAPANSLVCPTCLSQPGSKPMGMNQKAFENSLKIAVALGCKPAEGGVYVQRKHYIYPDLSSGYQRTSKPLATGGSLAGVRIREVHIEEDPGQYDLRSGEVNFNRSGVPLVEIVTEPDFTDAEHARKFLEELSAIMDYLDAGRVEPGSTRVDANISIEGNPRVEVKNINSFKGVVTALTFEEARQKNMVKHGRELFQETRHFDEGTGTTKAMRRKETADDYRYFPDPDVPPLEVTGAEYAAVGSKLPELPRQKRARLVKQYGITEDEAYAISLEKQTANAFETAARKTNAKRLGNFMRGVLRKQLNFRDLRYEDSKATPDVLVEIVNMIDKAEITEKVAEKLLIEFLDKGVPPRQHAHAEGLAGVQKAGELDVVIEKIIAENPKAVADYKAGKVEALHFLVGQLMKATRGKAHPDDAKKALLAKLG